MRFDEITGNERTKARLSALEGAGRMPHALILEGGDEQARAAFARQIARWAVCDSAGDKPCGLCAACRKAASGNHPDIFIAQGGSGPKSFHVDVIRTIRADAYILPNEAPRKVYLLLEAGAMTEQAQNALLKILEEPPERVLFVIACRSAASLLDTVRSRSQTLTLDTGEGEGKDQPAFALAEQIAAAVPNPREYELLCLTGKLVKDKELCRGVLGQLALVFRDACVCGFTGGAPLSGSKEAANLAQRLPRARLMELLSVVEEARRRMDQNANQNLLATWLCARMRADF